MRVTFAADFWNRLLLGMGFVGRNILNIASVRTYDKFILTGQNGFATALNGPYILQKCS